jgi:hypothetical protein
MPEGAHRAGLTFSLVEIEASRKSFSILKRFKGIMLFSCLANDQRPTTKDCLFEDAQDAGIVLGSLFPVEEDQGDQPVSLWGPPQVAVGPRPRGASGRIGVLTGGEETYKPLRIFKGLKGIMLFSCLANDQRPTTNDCLFEDAQGAHIVLGSLFPVPSSRGSRGPVWPRTESQEPIAAF